MKKCISMLLGAGFSAPMGYPIGNQLNERLLNYQHYSVGVSLDGKLFFLNPNQKDTTMGNPYRVYLECCIRLIKEYSQQNQFDYEVFFEFLTQKEYLSNPIYLDVCKSFTNDTLTIANIASNLDAIYNQMVSSLLKDGTGRHWYDNMPNYIGKIDEYDGFLNLLKEWRKNSVVHVHTLNHDMLFESFNRTDYISGEICDGFDELGSDYYGKLRTIDNRTYHVRLERFTGVYNRHIRLYKLHGSLDYVLYYRTAEDGVSLVPDKYVKTRYGIGYDNLLRDTHVGDTYEQYPFAYHANYLTGTSSKIRKYEDPLLFKPLFASFKDNLHNSELLIIIGYGCKDKGINEIIANYFKGRKVYIVDPYFEGNETVKEFATRINAKLIKTQIADLSIDEFI